MRGASRGASRVRPASACGVLLAAAIGAHGARRVVDCESTAGAFTITLEDEWSPKGVARFLELVHAKFFDGQILYRVIPGFIAQFGVAADAKVQQRWQVRRIPDEPKHRGFDHGTVSFAGAGVDSRSCHIFIALRPSGVSLGSAPHETAIGQVTEGIEVLDVIQRNFEKSSYGDLTSLQQQLTAKGNIAAAGYPALDRITTCVEVGPGQQSRGDPRRGRGEAKAEAQLTGTEVVTAAFRNEHSKLPAYLFWRDQRGEGKEVPMGAIQPGEEKRLQTSSGHVFVARSGPAPEDQLLSQIMATTDPGQSYVVLHREDL